MADTKQIKSAGNHGVKIATFLMDLGEDPEMPKGL